MVAAALVEVATAATPTDVQKKPMTPKEEKAPCSSCSTQLPMTRLRICKTCQVERVNFLGKSQIFQLCADCALENHNGHEVKIFAKLLTEVWFSAEKK